MQRTLIHLTLLLLLALPFLAPPPRTQAPPAPGDAGPDLPIRPPTTGIGRAAVC